MIAAPFFVVVLSAVQVAPSSPSATDLTRALNSGPPFTAQPAQPDTVPASAPAATAPARQTLPPIGGSAPLFSRPTPPAATRAPADDAPPAGRAVSNTPASRTVSPARPAPRTPPIGGAAPLSSRTPSPIVAAPVAAAPPTRSVDAAPATPPARAASSAPDGSTALDAAAVAALPFTIDLTPDLRIVEGRSGPDADVYSVKRGDRTLVMIYAGPVSQFPIYDGQIVQAGGRASVVVTEDGRRLALEHLFQRAVAPREIHVWVASVTEADRALAERIGQSVDIR